MNRKEKVSKYLIGGFGAYFQNWSQFMSIIYDIPYLDQHLNGQVKLTKIIHPLPHSFYAIFMASKLSTTSFYDITSVISANIVCHKNICTWTQVRNTPQAYLTWCGISSRGREIWRRGRGRGVNIQGSNDERTCHYCGKPDHFIKFCLFRIIEEEKVALGSRPLIPMVLIIMVKVVSPHSMPNILYQRWSWTTISEQWWHSCCQFRRNELNCVRYSSPPTPLVLLH